MFFTEFENYVDGGVLANNPCDFGLTEIQNFYRAQKKKLKIALVVSVGSGVFPAEELGKVDAQEFFFGKHWFNFKDTIKSRAQNLLALLTTAVSPGLLCCSSNTMLSTVGSMVLSRIFYLGEKILKGMVGRGLQS